MNNELLYLAALNMIEGIGCVTARQLVSYCGSAEKVFQTPESKLLKIPHIGLQTAQLVAKKDTLQQAEKELTLAEKSKVRILSFTDADYPIRLKNLHDAPLLLYLQGEVSLNQSKIVAIVGTREATDYGRVVTEQIIQDLKQYEVLIISGLAYGIDITAHRACLKYSVPTVGVMANGIDNIYPAVHRKTAHQMVAEQGGILTENPFGTKPDAGRFPARNRIIAGLADAVIVAEAKNKGGALITADIANSYHRDVFAVPGNLNQPASEGCNYLIKAHQANLLTSVVDLAYLMNWHLSGYQSAKQATLDFDQLGLSEVEKQIIQCLKENLPHEVFLDEMSYKLSLSIGQLNASLLNLELLGLVRALPGKKFGLV
jgi:DNA processing protein